MTFLRTKLVVRLQNDRVNSDIEFRKGAPIVGVVGELLRYSEIDVAKARKAIDKVFNDLELKEKRK